VYVRPLWKFTAFMLPLFLGCVALGVWQLGRLQWKLSLIHQADSNLSAPLVPVAQALALGPEAAQYRRVSLSGRFENSKEAYVFGTAAGGTPVYHVVTPFRLDDGGILLVDRGIVPERLRDPRTRPDGERQGEQRLTGVWRIPDAPGLFTPAPNASQRIWYARDVKGIAESNHLKLAAPVLVEADATPNPGGWPKGGQTIIHFRNEHLQYAVTWFALAAVIFGGWVSYHVSQRRLGGN
jgi:surfeit locus 1 family protein